MKKKIAGTVGAALGLLAITEAGASAYFYRIAMKRNKRGWLQLIIYYLGI